MLQSNPQQTIIEWACPNECEISHVLVCGGDFGNTEVPNQYFQMQLDGL